MLGGLVDLWYVSETQCPQNGMQADILFQQQNMATMSPNLSLLSKLATSFLIKKKYF